MSMYFVKQGDISGSNKPELNPFESKQFPNPNSGFSQFQKTLERLKEWQSPKMKFRLFELKLL